MAELTSDALLLILGLALTVVGIFFFRFCAWESWFSSWGYPGHRPCRTGDQNAARDVSRVSARLCVPSVYAASSGPTRSNCR